MKSKKSISYREESKTIQNISNYLSFLRYLKKSDVLQFFWEDLVFAKFGLTKIELDKKTIDCINNKGYKCIVCDFDYNNVSLSIIYDRLPLIFPQYGYDKVKDTIKEPTLVCDRCREGFMNMSLHKYKK